MIISLANSIEPLGLQIISSVNFGLSNLEIRYSFLIENSFSLLIDMLSPFQSHLLKLQVIRLMDL